MSFVPIIICRHLLEPILSSTLNPSDIPARSHSDKNTVKLLERPLSEKWEVNKTVNLIMCDWSPSREGDIPVKWLLSFLIVEHFSSKISP